MPFQKKVLREGTGPSPTPGRNVTVHCTGYGKNRDLNQKFWSTKDPGQQPFTFCIGRNEVIKGWDEGVMTMVCLNICVSKQYKRKIHSCNTSSSLLSLPYMHGNTLYLQYSVYL
jgi:hypothetical protein